MLDKKKNQFLPLRLRVESPVHIGCDEVYEPTGFALDEEEYRLIHFDTASFIAGLSEPDRLMYSEICRKGTIESILELYKFIRGRKPEGGEVAVCNEFRNHYDQILSIPLNNRTKIQQELNHFIIERTAYSPNDGRPYIPGSAVKGTLRTACLNMLAKSKNININLKDKNAGRSLQASLLDLDRNFIAQDPFRLVKVSDFWPVGSAVTKIVYAVNKKKKSSQYEARGPYQILEVIEPGAVFCGSLSVEEPQNGAGIKNPLSLETLLSSLDRFFGSENKREDKELQAIDASGTAITVAKNTSLLRIGRHSGSESMTVEGYCDIRIMQKRGEKPRFEDRATTVWLSSETRKPQTNLNLRPFGWITWEKLSPYDFKKITKQEKELQLARESKLAESLDEERAKQQKLAELKQRDEEEKKRRDEEEARRRAAFDARSPVERDIETLKNTILDENSVYEIYGRLNDYEENERPALAAALKEHWKSRGKWKKNETSKKQWEKVREIKAILGED